MEVCGARQGSRTTATTIAAAIIVIVALAWFDGAPRGSSAGLGVGRLGGRKVVVEHWIELCEMRSVPTKHAGEVRITDASVGDSVGDGVGDSVGDSVGDGVGDSVGDADGA